MKSHEKPWEKVGETKRNDEKPWEKLWENMRNHIFSLSCQNWPFLRVFLKASKMIFDQKNKVFLTSCFTTDEEIFVVWNQSEKHSEKQCFLILSSFSHNLTGKLIFSQKEWVRHQIRSLLFAFDAYKCCFWCFQITLLMLYYTIKASKVLKLKDLRMERVHWTFQPEARQRIQFDARPGVQKSIHRHKVKRHRVKRQMAKKQQKVKRQKVKRHRVKNYDKRAKFHLDCFWLIWTTFLFIRTSSAALGPLDCPSRSAWPKYCLNLT